MHRKNVSTFSTLLTCKHTLLRQYLNWYINNNYACRGSVYACFCQVVFVKLDVGELWKTILFLHLFTFHVLRPVHTVDDNNKDIVLKIVLNIKE